MRTAIAIAIAIAIVALLLIPAPAHATWQSWGWVAQIEKRNSWCYYHRPYQPMFDACRRRWHR